MYALLVYAALLFAPIYSQSLQCQQQADEWCNNEKSCIAAVEKHNESLPLYARDDRSAKSKAKEWRCYSASSLSPDLKNYTNGTAYCSHDAEIRDVLQNCAHPDPHSITVNATMAFTPNDTAACAEIRTPELVLTPSAVLLFAQCRHSKKENTRGAQYGDDFRQTKMIMKRSTDMGKTWGAMSYISPIDTGVGVAIYDEDTKTVILQYQRMPNSNPYDNNTLFQVCKCLIC
jgi:hypothetical protein